MARPEIDQLLAQDAWLRHLAHTLVRDPALAEDVAQEAWLAALREGPPPRNLKPWLGGVLRNVWRDLLRRNARREERERRSARGEARESTDEVVAELALRRQVVDVLAQLEEPYRTVLFRRFFRNESLKSIAKQQGVAISTVHGRLQKGLVLMREHLDSAHGGDRRSWALGLMSLAAPAGKVGMALSGGLVMGTGIKLAAATITLAAAAGLWIGIDSARQSEGRQSVAAADETPAELERPPLETETIAPTSERAVALIPTRDDEPVSSRLSLRGVVQDTSGLPLAGLRVVWQKQAATIVSESTGDGSFLIELPPETSAEEAEDHGNLSIDDPVYLLAIESKTAAELRLIATPRRHYAGVVLDGDGAPVADCVLNVHLRHSLFRELGLSHGLKRQPIRWSTRTSSDGRFELPESAGGESAFLQSEHAGFQEKRTDLPPHDDLDLIIRLQPPTDTEDLIGIVVDPKGSPVSGAKVSVGNEITQTGADGRFSLPWDSRMTRNAPYAKDPDGVWRARKIQTHIAAVHSDHLPARLAIDTELARQLIVLELAEGPLSIEGRVADADGRSLEGIVLWLRDPTHFGQVTLSGDEGVVRLQSTVEEELRGGRGQRGTRTDAAGRFRIEGLLSREYDVQAFDPGTASFGPGWKLVAGSEDSELVLQQEPSCRRVAGRVLSTAEAPLPHVSIVPLRTQGTTPYSQPPFGETSRLYTDEEGRFAFASLATAGTELQIQGEGLFMNFVKLEDYDELEQIEIVVPLLCELQIELQDPDLADNAQILDADGEPLDILEPLGTFITQSDNVDVTDGKTSVLMVDERAATLVLRRDGEEVSRVPLRLDPAKRTNLTL